MRADSQGYGVYVADFQSGKPIPECDFYIYDADKEPLAKVEGVKMDGYTRLPEEISKYITKDYKYYYFRAGFKDGGRQRWTQYISMRSPNPGAVQPIVNSNISRAVLITDRGAYNPGETVQFKAVLYSGTYEYSLCPEGTAVKAILIDTQGKEVSTLDLTTNSFGSVSGSFALEGVTRGGMYRVRIENKEKSLATREIRVDEFVLPTFEMIWDPDPELYLPGDKVRVSGKVKAYSGHSLANAKLYYSVEETKPAINEKELALSADGSFSFEFQSKSSYGETYSINVKIVDATGETLSFNTWRSVRGSLPLRISLQNKVPGQYSLAGDARINWASRDSWPIPSRPWM